MRPTILSLFLCTIGSSCFAEEPAIPQDKAAQARRRAESLAWFRKTSVEAYDRIGKKDPKWDAAARRALEAYAESRHWSFEHADSLRVLHEAAEEAVKAGCDDPFIQYLHARGYYGFAGVDRRDAKATIAAAAALARSDYPAVRRAHAILNAAASSNPEGPPSKTGRKEQERLLNESLALLPEILRDQNSEARREVYAICKPALVQSMKLAGKNWEQGLKRVTAALAAAPNTTAMIGTVTGHVFVKAAWEARGTGTIDTVTVEGGFLFEKNLKRAEEALQAAWTADPTDPETCVEMLTVCIGLGHPRAEMEKWFELAMKLDGDCKAACAAKLNYLYPKWLGSVEELFAFTNALVKTGNFDAGLPLYLVTAHLELAKRMTPEEYLAAVPGAWEDIHDMMTLALKQKPDSKCLRTLYAKWATQFGKWDEADEQFTKLGKDYWRLYFKSDADAQELMDKAKAKATKKD